MTKAIARFLGKILYYENKDFSIVTEYLWRISPSQYGRNWGYNNFILLSQILFCRSKLLRIFLSQILFLLFFWYLIVCYVLVLEMKGLLWVLLHKVQNVFSCVYSLHIFIHLIWIFIGEKNMRTDNPYSGCLTGYFLDKSWYKVHQLQS